MVIYNYENKQMLCFESFLFMKLFFKYKSKLSDNLKFKKISRDLNPLHFDKKFLLETPFSYPVVQGQLLVMHALINIKKKNIIKNFSEIMSIEAKFNKLTLVGEKVFFKYSKNNKFIKIQVYNYFEDKLFLKIFIKKNNILKNEKIRFKFLNSNLILNSEEKKFIESILKISELVGNYKNKINILLSYKYEKKNNVKVGNSYFQRSGTNFANLYSKHKSYSFNSNFLTFNRFNKLLTLQEKIKFNKKIQEKLFNKKILVIGGTGGIGYILVNFLKKINANFDFTYNTNKKVADKICKKLLLSKDQIFYFNHNKLNNKKIIKKLLNYDIFLFLITPKIFTGRLKFFDNKKFETFNSVYLKTLNNIVEILKVSNKKHKIFIPSTTIIDKKNNKSPEYSISKIVIENYSKALNKSLKNINIVLQRLDAYYSKQTMFMMGIKKDLNLLISNIFYRL
jgi:hypothetical protein